MTIRLGGIIFGIALTAILVLWSLLPGLINYASPEKPDYYAFQEPNLTPEGGFSFEGPMGTWDTQQLQRGYQVYKEVCSACHSIAASNSSMSMIGVLREPVAFIFPTAFRLRYGSSCCPLPAQTLRARGL